MDGKCSHLPDSVLDTILSAKIEEVNLGKTGADHSPSDESRLHSD